MAGDLSVPLPSLRGFAVSAEAGETLSLVACCVLSLVTGVISLDSAGLCEADSDCLPERLAASLGLSSNCIDPDSLPLSSMAKLCSYFSPNDICLPPEEPVVVVVPLW